MPRVTLTDQERQLLAMLAEGHTWDATAHRLGVLPRTLRRHLRGLRARLGAATTMEAVAIVARRRLI